MLQCNAIAWTAALTCNNGKLNGIGTKPGCDAPAYHSQVHHVQGWTSTRRTDINDLTLACGVDNRLAEKGWITRKNARGDTEWLPPPHLDRGQPRTNPYHHPERFLSDDDEPV
jgi:hypothetical protein